MQNVTSRCNAIRIASRLPGATPEGLKRHLKELVREGRTANLSELKEMTNLFEYLLAKLQGNLFRTAFETALGLLEQEVKEFEKAKLERQPWSARWTRLAVVIAARRSEYSLEYVTPLHKAIRALMPIPEYGSDRVLALGLEALRKMRARGAMPTTPANYSFAKGAPRVDVPVSRRSS